MPDCCRRLAAQIDVENWSQQMEAEMPGDGSPSVNTGTNVQAALDAAAARADKVTIQTAEFTAKMSEINAKNHAAKQIMS
jgi:hypothetical protein